MSAVDIDRLRRLLGSDEMRWVVERVHTRLARGQPLTGPISLSSATPGQRRALETLLGRRPRLGRSLTVSLADIDTVIRRSGIHADGLGAAVAALHGPVTVRADEHAAMEEAWQRALAPLSAVAAERTMLNPWYELVSARGLVKRRCGTPEAATPVVEAAARLLRLLPVTGTPLGQLATVVAGDAHALDHGRAVAAIALSAIRHTWWVGSTDKSPAQQRRALWDCVGVVTDELSSTVLALNLRVHGSAAGLTPILHAAARCGEPMVLTLRQLLRHSVSFEPGPVFVCENPAVVLAAANALGATCPPLVCIGGQPTAAALRLLAQLDSAGCSLRYHGDFDWGGIRIANLLWSRYSVHPWRFDAGSYVSGAEHGGTTLSGRPAEAAWDPGLSQAIAERGVRVEEEAVLADLLADLAEFAP